ncbi:hypothetical protein [Pontibacter saemangeumensis]
MEDNKAKAVLEEMEYELDAKQAKRLFTNIYAFILYNNTQCFLYMLDYRMRLTPQEKAREDYFLFRFLLRQMRELYPSELLSLLSNRQHAA